MFKASGFKLFLVSGRHNPPTFTVTQTVHYMIHRGGRRSPRNFLNLRLFNGFFKGFTLAFGFRV